MRLETERLLLRPIETSDLDAFVALHSDPEVTRFIRALGRDEAVERLRLAAREWQECGYGMLAVIERSSGRFIGRAGLKYWSQFEETELGWALGKDAWGRGYASESARACAQWALSTFTMPYLTAMIQPANLSSIRVAERLGMAPLRNDVLLGDAVIVYALHREPGTQAPGTASAQNYSETSSASHTNDSGIDGPR